MKSRPIVSPRFLVAALAMLTAGGLLVAQSKSAAPAPSAAPSLPVAPSTPAAQSSLTAPPLNIVGRGTFRSVLKPAVDLPLSARAPGIIEAIHVIEGAEVKKGQPIITLDSDREKAEVAQAEASVRGALEEKERAAAEYDRIAQLSNENISSVSKKQLIDAKAQAGLALSRHDQAIATLQLAKVGLENRTISSSIDGIFYKTNKQVGESVDRYEQVARVIDITWLEMIVYCDAKYFSKFRSGQKVEVRVFKSAEEQPIITGVVFHTDPIVDPSSGTFRVKIKIDKSDNSVPGLAAFLISPAS